MKSKFQDLKIIVNNYKFNSIYFQYFRRILLYFSIPCIFFYSVIGLIYTYNYMSSQQYNSVNMFWKTRSIIDNLFDDVDRKHKLFENDRSVQDYIQLDENTHYLAENNFVISQTKKIINSTLVSSRFIDSVYLYSFSSDYVMAISKFSGATSNSIDKFSDKQWYIKYINKRKDRLIFTEDESESGFDSFTVMYELKNENNVIGLIVFKINTKNFEEILNTKKKGVTEILYLTERNNIIFTSADIDKKYLIENTNDEQILIKHYPASKILCSADLDNIELRFNILSDYSSSGVNKFLMITILLLIVLVAIIFPVFISFILSSKLFTSIAQIVKYLQKFETAEINNNQENELKYIIYNIQSMVEKGKNLEKELAKNISTLKQTQIISLQTQINPHFLFNTLNSLTLLSRRKNDNGRIDILVRNLSNLLEYALDSDRSTVTLREELEYVNYYIAIEEIKYQVKINVVWNISQEYMECNIIKFILQPIIENSFIHGFKRAFNEKQQIVVDAYGNDEYLCITVTDNGTGISKDKVLELNSKFKEGYFPVKKHIGLCNLNKRIQLLYNERYGCSIESEEGRGTVVTIKIPVNLE